MNIIFVCHGGLLCQSIYHILSIAEQLSELGDNCVVCVPDDANDGDRSIRPSCIPILTFEQAEKLGIEFCNQIGPSLIHCWTPREQVRDFTMGLVSRYKIPYFVHLEDNEREILNRELKDITYEELTKLPAPDQGKYILHSKLRIHPHNHWEFLQRSSGCTVLIDRLAEHVPTGIPIQLFWPGYDDCFANVLHESKKELRLKYGIPESSFVVLYSGTFNGINQEEIHLMVIALKILYNRGMPLIFVKTGHNQFPEFLEDGIEKGWIKDLGFLPRNDLPEVFSMCDVLVQPGCSDPFNDYRFPSKLPEALVSGVPIILPYSNLGRILKDKNEAIVLHDDSIDGLIAQIAYLFDHSTDRIEIGHNGRSFCIEHLDWKIAARTIHDFYEACLNETPENLIATGRVQTARTDNLTRSSSPVEEEVGGRLSAPSEFSEIYRIIREEMNLNEDYAHLTRVANSRFSELHRSYKRKKRRLKRFRLISIIEFGVILVLIIIMNYSK